MAFKMYISFDQTINDVAIHLDRETAKDLMLYLIHSVSKEYKKQKFLGCNNPIAIKAEKGDENSKRIMMIREKLLELLVEKVS